MRGDIEVGFEYPQFAKLIKINDKTVSKSVFTIKSNLKISETYSKCKFVKSQSAKIVARCFFFKRTVLLSECCESGKTGSYEKEFFGMGMWD